MSGDRTLRGDFTRVRDGLADATDEARAFVEERVDARPLAAIGAAAGLGFLLGGGVTRHSLALLLGVGARLAATHFGEELAGALDRDPHTDTTRSD